MSPVYCYQHVEESSSGSCPTGGDFEWDQVAQDLPLSVCPHCGAKVERTLSAASIRTKKFDCELKDLGFTKLKRVDDGIFENLTRRHGEEKYIDRRKPETFPDLSKTVKD